MRRYALRCVNKPQPATRRAALTREMLEDQRRKSENNRRKRLETQNRYVRYFATTLQLKAASKSVKLGIKDRYCNLLSSPPSYRALQRSAYLGHPIDNMAGIRTSGSEQNANAFSLLLRARPWTLRQCGWLHPRQSRGSSQKLDKFYWSQSLLLGWVFSSRRLTGFGSKARFR